MSVRFPDYAALPLDLSAPLPAGPARAPWRTPEGIEVAPAYGPDAIAGLDDIHGLPGLAPFSRGPYPTMYAGAPWTIRDCGGQGGRQPPHCGVVFVGGSPQRNHKQKNKNLEASNPPPRVFRIPLWWFVQC